MGVAAVWTQYSMCGFYYTSEKHYNKTESRKARYWFANEVMNMADEPSKNSDIKLMEGQTQTISKDDILEVIGKGKPFKLLKELINNKKFTPELPDDKFALTLICINIFATLLHEISPQGPTKGNAQLIRQNDFSFT